MLRGHSTDRRLQPHGAAGCGCGGMAACRLRLWCDGQRTAGCSCGVMGSVLQAAVVVRPCVSGASRARSRPMHQCTGISPAYCQREVPGGLAFARRAAGVLHVYCQREVRDGLTFSRRAAGVLLGALQVYCARTASGRCGPMAPLPRALQAYCQRAASRGWLGFRSWHTLQARMPPHVPPLPLPCPGLRVLRSQPLPCTETPLAASLPACRCLWWLGSLLPLPSAPTHAVSVRCATWIIMRALFAVPCPGFRALRHARTLLGPCFIQATRASSCDLCFRFQGRWALRCC